MYLLLTAILSFLYASSAFSQEGWRTEFKQNYVNGCMQLNTNTPQMTRSFTRTEINWMCDCASKYVADRITDQDFEQVFRSESYESVKPLVVAANNQCSSQLLARKGLGYQGQTGLIRQDYLPTQIRSSYRPNGESLLHSFMSGLLTAQNVILYIPAIAFDAIGLSDFSRGVYATINSSNKTKNRQPQVMIANDIQSLSHIFIFIGSHLLFLIGILFYPICFYMLYKTFAKATKKNDG